jgi:DNA-directed RNA polymerase sigma subunit (sigma70/sigma32)
MQNKSKKEELELVMGAATDIRSKNELREYLAPLVAAIAKPYTENEQAKFFSRHQVINAGWKYLDLAIDNFLKDPVQGKGEKCFFSTYFTWYIRQGIVEFLNR